MPTNTATNHTSAEECNPQAQCESLPKILDEVAYLRIWQIADCRKPGVNPLLPVSRTTFLDQVKSGKFPKPIKIGRTSCWKSEDIKNLIIELGQSA